MPSVTESPARAYAHCRNARCPGYQQEEIAGVREEVGFTYRELNGNKGAPDPYDGLLERSSVRFRFEDESQAPCPACGEAREVTGEPRPSYQPLSGHDPLGLLQFGGFDPSQVVVPDDRTAALEAQLQEMREQLAKLTEGKE
jgi:hypothetical protein